jgi:hypothetical protein
MNRPTISHMKEADCIFSRYPPPNTGAIGDDIGLRQLWDDRR